MRPRPVYFLPFNLIEILSLYSHQVLLKVQICFRVLFVLYAYSENTPKVFYRSSRIRQKYLIVFGECAKSLI